MKQVRFVVVLNDMDNVSKKDKDWLLTLHKDSSTSPYNNDKLKTKFTVKRVLFGSFILMIGITGLVIIPFLLLIRISVVLNTSHDYSAMTALAGGVFSSVLLLMIYMLFLFQKVKSKKLRLQFSFCSAGLMVIAFCVTSLLYLSSVHAKSPEVGNVYRSMHPILRIAISTVTLADGDLVITDIQRKSSDYNKMGLPENPNSLHYKQEKTGYVHAVDLRTVGRSEIRNFLLQFSLHMMGFKTIRHVGTADHLHVELGL